MGLEPLKDRADETGNTQGMCLLAKCQTCLKRSEDVHSSKPRPLSQVESVCFGPVGARHGIDL